MIIFTWTPPHFWALAIARRADYAKVDIPMLPVTHGVAYTRLSVLLYTLMLMPITVLPFATRMSGLLYLGAAVLLDAGFAWHAVRLMSARTDAAAMRVFRYSIVYLMWLFIALLVGPLLPDDPALNSQVADARLRRRMAAAAPIEPPTSPREAPEKHRSRATHAGRARP